MIEKMKKKTREINNPFMISLIEITRLFRTILKPSVLVTTFRGLKALISLKTLKTLRLSAAKSSREQITIKKSS